MLKPEVTLKGEESNIDETQDYGFQHPTKGYKLFEFFLQNNKTLKTSYFTSLFYYEPYVTEFSINELRDSIDVMDYHVFHSYFPRRKVYFYPKMIILQSSRPYFSFHKSFLDFYYNIVLKPYLSCTSPIKFKMMTSKIKTHIQDQSVIKHKEFFLSFLFSCKINHNTPTIKQLKFMDWQFEIDTLYYDRHYIEKSHFRLITKLFENKINARRLIMLYFYLLLERKVLIVHEKPSEFMLLLFNLLRPL